MKFDRFLYLLMIPVLYQTWKVSQFGFGTVKMGRVPMIQTKDTIKPSFQYTSLLTGSTDLSGSNDQTICL